MKKYEYDIVGLDCTNCANKIQVELGKVKGIENASVNFAKQKLSYETDTVSREKVEKLVKSLEPDVELISAEDKIKDLKNEKKQNENKSKFLLHILRLVIGTIVAVVGLYVPMPKILSTVLIILGYAILLYRTTKNAIKLLFKSKTINENLLITISCIGAYLVGKHSEGLMVIVLYEIGKILEEKAINKTRKSISDLMDIKPEYANLKTDNDIKVVSPADVEIGDIVVVKQGEKIPLDGIVVKGNASLNTSSLTGESKPQDVSEESEVLSGSIVLEGLLEIKVTEKYENSTVSKILELVENATDKKAKTETFVNKAAKIYTPIVLGIAVLVAIFLPLISNVPYGTENGSIYRALIFLVISCPCAIAISVPLCYFSGIGKSSKEGILIKGSDYLDGIKDIKEVVFDKTGTLTKGEFVIDKVELCTNNFSKDEVLEFAVLGESFSNHPIAKSIVGHFNINADKSRVSDYEEIAGKGIKYVIDGKTILVGNSSLVGKEAEKVDSTKIYVKIDEELAGSIYLKDEIKEGTKEAIAKLNEKGIVTKMFTGDNKEVASKIAEELGIKESEAEMLPNDKYTKLEKEIEKYKESNGKVAFVGDGINDSPVLALSDIGISMGGVGSQVAIEASDVVIMTDAIEKINEAINISKKTSRIIKQNLTFSIGIKVLVLVLSIFGIANMWEAVFADVGATLITVLNAIRILSK
ncbi:MAG: heavy metal translocating P-type ATPase [Christensenellales bacterium]